MKKSTKAVLTTISALVLISIFLNWKTNEKIYVKEGDIVGVNQYIHSQSMGGKEVVGSDFFLTFVKSKSSSFPFVQWVYKQTGYEKSITTNRNASCQQFDFEDENSYGKRIMSYMSQNAISSAMYAVGREPSSEWRDPVVLTTSHKSKVAKNFEPGDELISFNGEGIYTGETFYILMSRVQEGSLVEIELRRKGVLKKISFIANEKDCQGYLTAGILVETTVNLTNVDEEKVIETKNMSFVGDSAGLMLSLGLVQQLRPDDNLTHGLKIAGTGAIDGVGNIKGIGSLEMKIRTAIQKDADVFLYPASQTDEIKHSYSNQIRLIPVETLDQAIEELKKMK